MWSGPRNLSTASMRSFENRRDCTRWAGSPRWSPSTVGRSSAGR
ncbi:MAG: hypothetical protein ACRDPS_21045 [Nocardioides sp.]